MEKKTLHIDTLYLSYSCDFSAYKEAVDIISEKNHIYYRDGRQFYDFGYARIGWLDWDICERSNNYPFTIEYNFEYLYQVDLINNINSIKLPFSLNFDNYLIKRLDYNCTFKTMNHSILQSLFVSKYFKKGHDFWGTNREIETVNLGIRKTGKTFRIYNKSKELSDKKNHIKNDMLKQVFGSTSNLYSLEVELHRKYILSKLISKRRNHTLLKPSGSLSDWYLIIDMAKFLLGSIKYCENTSKNLKNIQNKHYNRIEFKNISEFIGAMQETKRIKNFKKSELNLLIAIDRILEQYNDYDGDIITPEELGQKVSDLRVTKITNGIN